LPLVWRLYFKTTREKISERAHMNGRQAKKLRRMVRQAGREEALNAFIRTIDRASLRERIYLAWKIITKTVVRSNPLASRSLPASGKEVVR
jgi:hypothetical protein